MPCWTRAQPLGIFCCAKALGLDTHVGAKAPGCPGGGVITGQIDTCVTEHYPDSQVISQQELRTRACYTLSINIVNACKTYQL